MGCVLPPLLSTRLKGTWDRSPWRLQDPAATRTPVYPDEDLGFDAIPADMDEWEQWRRVRDMEKKVADASGSNSPAAAQAPTTAIAGPRQEKEKKGLRTSAAITSNANRPTTTAVPASPTSANPAFRQTSLTGTLPSTKATIPTNLNSKTKTTSISTSDPGSTPHARTHAWTSTPTALTTSRPVPAVKAQSLGASPISKSIPISSSDSKRQRNNVSTKSLTRVNVAVVEVQTSLAVDEVEGQHDLKGRSLGEDEDILFEQGSTQMEFKPSTQGGGAAHSSPIKAASKPSQTLSRSQTLPHCRSSEPPPPLPPPTPTPPRLTRAASFLSPTSSPSTSSQAKRLMDSISSALGFSSKTSEKGSPPRTTLSLEKERRNSVVVISVGKEGGLEKVDSLAKITSARPLSSFPSTQDVEDQDDDREETGLEGRLNKRRRTDSTLQAEVDDISRYLQEDGEAE